MQLLNTQNKHGIRDKKRMPPLYERKDLPNRGRCLVANSPLEKGQLIFCEPPLLALQSLENQQFVKVCHGCKAFVGNADWALRHDKEMTSPFVTPCRHDCGQVFCSPECEKDSWEGFHQHLCTGKCTSMEDPLVKFKQFATQTNEILLLVAEWWVAQHSCAETQQHVYTDFCMEPWWDVVSSDLAHYTEGSDEAAVLQKSTREICETAAELLSQVFHETKGIPPITALDIAQRIGACEQNQMGIRQRNPLCRAVLEEPKLRSERHHEICQLLAEAGFIGEEDDIDVDSNDNNGVDGDEEEHGESQASNSRRQEWEYSEDEIARFLSNLYIDEDGTVRDESETNSKKLSQGEDNAEEEQEERDSMGDDLDYVFLPLDGTAMYATTCKMNHSCDPNVVILYLPSQKWNEPLAAHAVALKNVAVGEELTISYVEINGSLEMRQEALSNYGFQCTCERCLREKGDEGFNLRSQLFDAPPHDVNDLFGDDDEDDESEYYNEEEPTLSNQPFHDDPFGSDNDDDNDDDGSPVDTEAESKSQSESDGNILLEKRLNRLDTTSNHAMPQIPRILLAKVSTFVFQHAKQIAEALPDESLAKQLVPQCSRAMVDHDFCMCRILGRELEETLFSTLTKQGSFSIAAERHAYWIACLVAAVGCSHICRFVTAMQYLDKVMILGLARNEYRQLDDFILYVEQFAAQKTRGPYSQRGLSACAASNFPSLETLSTAYKHDNLNKRSVHLGPCPEMDCSASSSLSWDVFQKDFVQKGQPLVLRNFAKDWPACSSWTNLTNICLDQGHRLVPLELGSMMKTSDANDGNGDQDMKGKNRGMKEQLITLRQLVDDFLLPSNEHGILTLQDATATPPPMDIAYLAQHPLLSQIPALISSTNLEMKPPLCGPNGPTHVYTWIGTGGTRTPLHFDSYDNIFVQVAGAKYIRLYSPQATPNLYVKRDGGYGLQGNMSDLDCEREDWKAHPLAKDLECYEVVLMPGDALFLPCHWWHYVRSLSTSVSMNYWF